MTPMRVMLAGDSVLHCRLLEAQLRRAGGFEVVERVQSGRLLLRQVERLAPPVIALGLSLPGMDSLEVLRRIMKEHPTRVAKGVAGQVASPAEIGKLLAEDAKHIKGGAYAR